MTMFLRCLLLLVGTFIALAVLPPNLEVWLAARHPYQVDCSKPLEVGQHRVRAVVADGRDIVRCRT